MNLIWKQRELKFRERTLSALVTSASPQSILESEQARLQREHTDETVIILSPPSPQGEPADFTPTGAPIYDVKVLPSELWKIEDLGSFESIEFAKKILNAPEDEYICDPASFLTQVTDALSNEFMEGDFRLSFACGAFLTFDLLPYGSNMTKSRYNLLNRELPRIFKPPYPEYPKRFMKAEHASASHCFVLGLV